MANKEVTVVSSWESEGFGHPSWKYPEIENQYQVCEAMGLSLPEIDTKWKSCSTQTVIIADKQILDYVKPIYQEDEI